MTDETLVTLLGGAPIGSVSRDRRGRLRFIYLEEWRSADAAFPLSLSMPLAAAQHGHLVIDAFLWGLLPDNPIVLDRWARRFQVSARSAFALLSHVGEDCAGAVQFVRPERLDELLRPREPEVEWLTTAKIEERLRVLRSDHAAWRNDRDAGQFSLAGAQPKTAFLQRKGRFGIPTGRTPTTHILKPPTGEFDGHAENEHFCLALARTLGIPAAGSEVRRFGKEVAIVVERYDRVLVSSAVKSRQTVLRLHQEDACQALGLTPAAKYQSDGGPGAADIVRLLMTHSSRPTEDIETFIDALAFNWAIAGSDAHAKNYSLLHGAGGRVRLAPLYDLASVLPYDFDLHRLKLAMKIGGKHRVREIARHQWEKLAVELRLDPEAIVARIRQMIAKIPDALALVEKQIATEGLRHRILEKLKRALAARADDLERAMA